MMITVFLLASIPRTNQRLGSLARLQERSSRAQFLLDSEIQEAESVSEIPNGLRLVVCEPHCSPGTQATIDYLWNPELQTLTRSGPGIDCRGALRLGGGAKDCGGNTISDNFDTHIVSTGVFDFSRVAASQAVRYTLSLRDPLDPDGPRYRKESHVRIKIKPS